MTKKYSLFILICLALIIIGWLWFMFFGNVETIDSYTTEQQLPRIKPDYSGTVIPVNIAPLNFMVCESGTKYMAKIHSEKGRSIEVFSRSGEIKMPLRRWKSLLNANPGKKLYFDIYVRDDDDVWIKYKSIVNTIANEKIDEYVVYRFMNPIYNWWQNIGIFQRNLTNYSESAVLKGESIGNGCLNCHTFFNNSPEKMTIAIRSSKYGSSVILAADGKVEKIGTKFGYTAWHPSGRIAIYSMNKVRQFFHKAGGEVRDVVDLDSALAYYDVDSQKLRTSSALSDKDRLETYPEWSPDGKYLYFSSAPILWEDRNAAPPENYDQVKYDLMRVGYDVQTDTWGQLETLLSAEETGLSILLPRISPDGSFLLFTMCQYGCFPVYQRSSDLYLMDLKTGKYRKLAINSEFSESWHSWSSNSRWFAFSSKRRDGLFTRTYFSYVDEAGKVYKQFILPQKDPVFYDSCLQTYSVPELITGPVPVSQRALAKAVKSKKTLEMDLPITSATPKTNDITEAWPQAHE